MCTTPAGAVAQPEALAAVNSAAWLEAPVPGTVAQALAMHGAFDPLDPSPLGQQDYWYRLRLSGTGRRLIRFHGLATIAEVWWNDALRLKSNSMFVCHEIDIDIGTDTNTLYICFRSLERHLSTSAPSKRARWRTRLVDTPSLRQVRTTLLGHMPGWFPSIEPIGPWRAIEIVDPGGPVRVWQHFVRASMSGRDGLLEVEIKLAAPVEERHDAWLRCGEHAAPLTELAPGTFSARLTLPEVRLWWPHTHGEPSLYEVTADIAGVRLSLGRTGFRTITLERGRDGRGFALSVNGTPLFVRGACWSSADPLCLHADTSAYQHYLRLAKSAGFNMIRVGGTMTYEADAFYTLCDELGLLVWQDFMFANFDYPLLDTGFAELVEREAIQFTTRTAGNPSLAVLCGGSEIAQQAAMVGLPQPQYSVELTENTLADITATYRPDAVYVGDSPHGGVLPFYPNEGASHYYGVGAYRRSLNDARRAAVRFASECLAFANIPCDATLEAIGSPAPHEPRWKRAVPRDPGASWDFDDVRDHYLHDLYRVDAGRLRSEDPARYLELSRAVIADVISETFAEWRRVGSVCSGALVWQMQDVVPGAGWGIVDAYRRPKSCWYAMKQSLQSRQILLTDEGLNGLDIHVFNDGQQTLEANVEIVAMRDGSMPLARARHEVRIDAHSSAVFNAAELLGQFFDFTYAYRFGPREHDTVIASMYSVNGGLLSQAFYFLDRTQAAIFERGDIGLEADVELIDGQWWVTLQTRRVARYVQISAPGFLPSDNWFHLAPGAVVRVELVIDSAPHSYPFARSDVRTFDANANTKPSTIEVRAVNSSKTARVRCK
ncbi:glycoside hydrolase family 2 protein [Paraburkholderia sp. MMS20-SJTR3]|uniref:beta-mannosidase n=1 Tax=Paraburkholderia sejongensis TaxID=2886946 RepID=A0ABS8K3T7_9BURK|nr:glycoside hydrolase family 2 protein [Paraburkholderia sp. MMS20-SJTR3]MCC8396824.1 glycoside hydrolase family 2 protein [Paraburkholderia sp. MMS20-SJTR3]